MKQLPTISIGIPAHNEEDNILHVLTALESQQVTQGQIKEIIVVSDGSTDNTVSQARKFTSSLVKLIDRKNRIGMNQTENEIMRLATGDVLVILNADVVPADTHLIEHLLYPLVSDPAIGLVGGDTIAAPAKTFVEWALVAGHEFKQEVYRNILSGNNIFLCHGRVRAFRKSYYKTVKFPDLGPEDAYSFLDCVSKGYTFVYAQNAKIIFRSPQTIDDHASQSLRFLQGKNTLCEYFPKDFVNAAFTIPFPIIVKTALWYGIRHPLRLSLYFFITIFIRIFYASRYVEIKTWKQARSSKKLIYD